MGTPQTSSTQLLVVTSDAGFAPPDEYFEELAFALLGAERPTKTTRVLSMIGRMATQSLGENAVVDLFDYLGSRQARGLKIVEQRSILIAVLRAIFSRSSSLILPGLRTIQASDPHLQTLHPVGQRFLEGVVYSAHPNDPDTFIPLSAFHQFLLDEKRAEFVRLTAALGAQNLRFVVTNGSKKDGSAHAGIKEPTASADIGVSAGLSTVASTSFDLSANFPSPQRLPTLPSKMKWFQREPLWQAMADARLQDWVGTFQVAFRYKEDFSINAGLAAAVEGIGLSVGGNFTSAVEVDQVYEISFHPKKSYQRLRD